MTNHLDTQLQKVKTEFKSVSILIMDIDFFKEVNDTHGHEAGDDVLKAFSGRIGKSVRGIDLACRFGGEEFVVVMPDTDLAVANGVAERLRCEIADYPFEVSRGSISLDITCSIGVTMSTPEDTTDSIMKRADDALYQAKRDGRNRVVTNTGA
jgi:two-component system cell cycle response regulator